MFPAKTNCINYLGQLSMAVNKLSPSLPSHRVQSSLILILSQVKLSRQDVDLLQRGGHPGPVLATLATGEA